MLQRQYYFFGTYFMEEQILDCWVEVARTAAVIFDVGANAGIYSLEALAAHPTAVVHAFEPTPEIAGWLRGTIELNGLDGLLVHEMAVACETGRATLRRYRGETGINEGMNYITHDDGPGCERISTVRLDEFCQSRGIDYIDLMKLDIQGNEAAALEGAGRLISDGRIGMIFMELNWGAGPDCPASMALGYLDRAGYVFSAPGSRLAWRSPGDWLRGLSDVVACAPSRAGLYAS